MSSPSTPPSIDYQSLMHHAMRGVVKAALDLVGKHGLPGAHHFVIVFDSRHAGVRMADWLAAKHPQEMTIILQHWFENLEVSEQGFAITLNFDNQPEPLFIPFAAVKAFFDPSVNFGLRFDAGQKDAGQKDGEEGGSPKEPAPGEPGWGPGYLAGSAPPIDFPTGSPLRKAAAL